MTTKAKKVEPHTPAWERKANDLARSYCPHIYPCGDCGNPVIDGYCCTYCGSRFPFKTDGKVAAERH